MKTKTIFNFANICLVTLALSACASRQATVLAYSPDTLTLDRAIAETALYFAQRLPSGTRIALVPFGAPTGRLSDYVFEELWGFLQYTGSFVMLDRINLARIDAEIMHQLSSGRVDDDFAVSITRQYGAQVLVYGQIRPMGNEYRMTVFATDVERATSTQRAFNIRIDTRLASLLNVSAEDEIERAIAAMTRELNYRTTVALGRIAFGNTQSVSGFSSWLRNSIIASAQNHREKIQIATERESSDFAIASRGLTVETPVANSAVQAVLMGNYSPLDSGAEVSIQIVSTSGNRIVLASTRFFIPASELERRRLSLLPPIGSAVASLVQFQERHQAVASFGSENNRWIFTVTPDVLDGIYYEGDLMTMRVFSERDAYFRITHVDVNGNVQIIFPVSPRDNNFIRAGETRRIPDNTRFRIVPPFGEEFILVAAYDRQFTNDPRAGAGTLSADFISRGLVVEDNRHTEMTPSATAMFSFTVLPR